MFYTNTRSPVKSSQEDLFEGVSRALRGPVEAAALPLGVDRLVTRPRQVPAEHPTPSGRLTPALRTATALPAARVVDHRNHVAHAPEPIASSAATRGR